MAENFMKMYELEFIETPRLLIRPVDIGDVIAINRAINNSLSSLQPWMPWAADPSLDATNTFVKKCIDNRNAKMGNDFQVVVIHKDTKSIIAVTGYNEDSAPARDIYELGYWIDSEYQGHGYVTEFANALTKYALLALLAKRVQIAVQTTNSKSIKVAERLGFKLELTRKNDRIDCLTQLPADGYLYTCCSLETMPPLEIKWKHLHD